MEKIILLSIAISVLFCIIKLLEMKYIEKEMPPLKFIVRDTLIVVISSFVPIFVFIKMSDKLGKIFGGASLSTSPEIFTDTPGF